MLLASLLASAASVEEFIQVDPGVHLRVLTRSSSPTLPVLLYQPFAGTWPQIHAGDAYFLPLTDSFSLVTFDPRGVGSSTGSFDSASELSDLLQVAEYAKAKYGRVYLMGISTSGPISIQALVHSPHLFEACIAVSPVINSEKALPLLVQEVERVWGVPASVFLSLPSVFQATLALLRLPYYKCHDRVLCTGEFYNPWTYAESPYYDHPFLTYLQAGVAMLRHLKTSSSNVENLTRFERPLHIVWGEHDYGLTPVSITREYAIRAANRYTELKDASHAAHIEQPEAFQESVRQMLPKAERGVSLPLPARKRSKTYTPRVLPFETQFVIGILILVVALTVSRLQPWVARKLVHMGIGALLVHADTSDLRIRYSVYAATALTASVAMAGAMASSSSKAQPAQKLVRFMHDKKVDPGILTYVATCSFCVAADIPFVSIMPLFFADPMGAVVGRNVKSPRVMGSKTLAGSAAVFLTALATLNDPSLPNRAVAAAAITCIELVAGDFDNPSIAVFLLARS